MNKLYLFLVLLAIVSCIKRKKQETDDSTDNLGTLMEQLKNVSPEVFDFLNSPEVLDFVYKKAKEFNELCKLRLESGEEDKELAEACENLEKFIEKVEEYYNGQE